jgi:tetratricopeptide (TPR) repeat protein
MHYAHERGVVHRDLKPANVLLAASGSVGDTAPLAARLFPKITDFGLAKRLDADAAGLTRSGAVLGTPAYMPPEQTSGPGQAAGPAMDVYALGAVLYETVTGRPPFQAATVLETLAQLRTLEPVPPRRLNPQVPRDLETIALKCLQKVPARRYASALGLADDLRRFLDGRPILARPVGAVERFARWCRRNPKPAGLAAALVVVVLLSLAGLWALWRHADGQRQAAVDSAAREQQHRERAETSYRLARVALADVTELQKDPRFQEGPLEDVKRRLQQAEAAFYQQFVTLQGDDPQFQAERATAFLRLGDLTHLLGSAQEAAAYYRQGIAIREALARDHPEDRENRRRLAIAYYNLGNTSRTLLGQFDAAEAALDQAQALQEALIRDHPAEESYQLDLARTLQKVSSLQRDADRRQAAAAAIHRALDLYALLAKRYPDDPDLLSEMGGLYNTLGGLHHSEGRLSEAEDAHQQAVALIERAARQHPDVPWYQTSLTAAYNRLATAYNDARRYPEAEAAARKALGVAERLARRHPAVVPYRASLASAHESLGMFSLTAGHFTEGQSAYRQALALYEPLVRDYPAVVTYAVSMAGCCCNLASLLRDSGRPEDAMEWCDKACDTLEGVLRRQSQHATARQFRVNVLVNRAATLERLGRRADAIRDLDRAIELDAGPKRASLRCARALIQTYVGNLAPALAEANDLAARNDLSAEGLYHLACVFARCAAKADRPPSQDAHADRAIELLARAHAAGFFKAPFQREHVAKNPDLAALRSRADFQKLLGKINRPPQPGK